jgi:signal transduction histidine kinase
VNALRPGLFGKLLLAFGLVLLPILAFLVFSFQAGLESQEATLMEDQSLTADAVAIQVETVIENATGLAWAVASMPLVGTLDPALLDPRLKRIASLNPTFDAISVFDAQGNHRGFGHATLPAQPRVNIAEQPLFRAVMATNAPALSGVIHLPRLGVPGIAVGVPIRDANGKGIGVTTVAMSTEQLAEHYQETRLRPGQTILLLNQEGRLVFHTGQRNPSPEDLNAYRNLPVVRSALSGTPSTISAFESPIFHDVHLGAFVPTSPHGWVVGVTIPREVALAPAYAALHRNLAAFAFLLLFSVGLAAWLTRRFVAPVRHLEQAALALGQGDLSTRVRLDTGDEIERLGRAFNAMATQIQEREAERTRLITQEASARAETEALKQLDKLKSDFVNAVSHELRTPLTSIKGYTEFLEDEIGGPLSPQQGEFVAQIDQSTLRLQRLVDDLLDFARMEAGTFALQCLETDLADKIQEMLASMTPQAQAARITLEASVPSEPLTVRMDPQRIDQVLTNLINNAIKFTPEGGRIVVRSAAQGDQLRLEVEDTGIGIAPEDVPKLFKRFGQLEAGTRKVGGTGLGLSISKAIVEAHGGAIGVTSEPGKGSTFWFTLPRVSTAC